MPRRTAWISLALLVVLSISLSRAEVPILRPEELKAQASHILVGKLKRVYRSVESNGGFEETRGIVEIVVEKVEKGEGPKPGEAAFVRFETRRWVGPGNPPPHDDGHDVPKAGAVIRAFVKRDKDGSFEALLPNGMEAVTGSR